MVTSLAPSKGEMPDPEGPGDWWPGEAARAERRAQGEVSSSPALCWGQEFPQKVEGRAEPSRGSGSWVGGRNTAGPDTTLASDTGVTGPWGVAGHDPAQPVLPSSHTGWQ